MVCSVLEQTLRHISGDTRFLFCADDFLVCIRFPPLQSMPLLKRILDVILCYGCHVGLRIDLEKSAVLLKELWTQAWHDQLRRFGIPVRNKVKFLGFLLGHKLVDDAFAWILARVVQRAAEATPPTCKERVTLFQQWMLPILIFPASAHCPTNALPNECSGGQTGQCALHGPSHQQLGAKTVHSRAQPIHG